MNLWARIAAAVVLLAAGAAAGVLLTRAEPMAAQVVRFTMQLPPGKRWAGSPLWDSQFALSPDGSRLVYMAYDSGANVHRLHVRTLDQLTSASLPGTENAVNPFFSPDGLWIGFIALGDRTLRKVAAAGGPVSQLAFNVGIQFGAPAWGDDGFIVYQDRVAQLARVSAGAGPPTMLTDSTTLLTAGAPVVLPGSRAVLMTGCALQGGGPDGCAAGLYVIDVAARKPKLLVENARRGWYLPGGYLVYGTGRALFAVKFDLGKLAVTSAPVVLLDGIMTSQRALARVAIASGSGTMAYVPAADADDAAIVQVGRDGREQVLVAKPGPYSNLRLSPDDRRIALSMPDATGRAQIWIHDRSSATTTPLTFDGNNIRPTWSPDGKHVAFSTSRVRGKNYIWSMPADGSSKGERAGEGPEIVGTAPVQWTRDNKWLVTDGAPEDGKGAGNEDIFAIPTSGKRTMQSVVATPADEQSGEVSPDGKWIAYGSNDTGRNQIYIQPFLMPGGRTLISTGGANQPAWAASNELVYVNTDADSVMLARLEFGATIKVTRTALFDFRPFQQGNNSVRAYDLTRDGKSFVVVKPPARRTASEPIVVLNWIEEVRRLMAAAGAKQ